MSIIKNFRSYLLEDSFSMHLHKDKINILNYENIDHISEKEISINYDEGLIIIKGEDLVLLKMLDDELLISGKIKNIELR